MAQAGEHASSGAEQARPRPAFMPARRMVARPVAGLFRVLRRGSPRWLWLFSAGQCLVLVAWMILDPRFDAVVYRLQMASGLGGASRGAATNGLPVAVCAGLLAGLIASVVLTHLLAFIRLFWGSRPHRALGTWLAYVTFVCLWIAMAMNWAHVTWWGKQLRLRNQVGGFEAVARELRVAWPRDDGQLATLDPFMAYPVGDPATLVMLTLPDTTRAGTSFSVIDRGESGALRFQLTGREAGDWLEWHPADEQPSSFIGGLWDAHELEQYWDLGEGWYLVRYR